MLRPFYLVARLAPEMVDRGDGAIFNLSTMVTNFGAAGMSLYGSSKAALQLLTKAWAAEFGPGGVRVNAVRPGPTLTDGTAKMQDLLNQKPATIPSTRVGTPTDVANAVVFVESPGGRPDPRRDTARRRRTNRHRASASPLTR